MRIEWATVCGDILKHGEGAYTLVAPLGSATYVPAAGGRLDLIVAVVTADSYENLREPVGHSVRCRVLDPELRCLSDRTATMTGVALERPPGFPEGSDQRGLLRLNVRVRVESFGAYTIEVSIDGATPWPIDHFVLEEA